VDIFNNTDTIDFFFTNDLRVLVDVVIRETLNLTNEQSKLRIQYLEVLFGILSNHPDFAKEGYKKEEIAIMLSSILDTFAPEDPAYKIAEHLVINVSLG